MLKRCSWCSDDPLYQAYHDHEWGKPLFDEAALFEMLCLEGQQAGLSWFTVLKKREAYRAHFFQYSIASIAQFTDIELQQKCQDTALIRHLGKLRAIRDNASAWHNLSQSHDMVQWLWSFSPVTPSHSESPQYIVTQSPESVAMSKALKQYGFKFVGPTICYAFMQAVGMVDDHESQCHFRNIPIGISKS